MDFAASDRVSSSDLPTIATSGVATGVTPEQVAKALHEQLTRQGYTPKALLSLSGEFVACITRSIAQTSPRTN